MSYRYILFDLDGTLTESGPGIKNGFEYAIKKMGGEVEDRSTLERFIGPPLEESFGNMLGYTGEDIQKGISFFREYYFNMGGITECNVYPGVIELLEELKKKELFLIVATSKLARGADIVLDHFDLKKYFDFVACTNDKEIKTKTEVIQHALKSCHIDDPKTALMVGDRHFDVDSAVELGLDSVGVLYGYGSRDELEKAGATYIAGSPRDILKLL
ncbi:MAG: HAD-IA family hydrolase [Lachnospiraceae bacterium]|nr:HAD-IA family hydrolase [Lachnospiraceae bacterium]